MQLKAFKCSWCNPKDSGKGQSKDNGGGAEGGAGDKTAPERPFCSGEEKQSPKRTFSGEADYRCRM